MNDPVTSTPLEGTVLAIGRAIVPNSFEEKLAKDLRVCASTQKSVSIAYHTFGDPSDPMVIFIPGMNGQGVSTFDSAACTWLAAKGYFVVRMDNRDVGLSTKFDDVPQRLNMLFYLLPRFLANFLGERQPYTLNDMADDASALIRLLAPGRKAHVVGISMGGMISQCIALRNPELVQSLTLVMTHSGNLPVAKAPIRTLLGFLHKPKSQSVEHLIELRNWFVDNYLCGIPLKDRTLLNLTAVEFTHRSLYRGGIKRHTTAISRAQCRDDLLKQMGAAPASERIPTHIIHGARDNIVPVGNGRYLHKLMPSAQYTEFPLMGHYIDDHNVQPFWDSLAEFLSKSMP